jgi:hypothetical protein
MNPEAISRRFPDFVHQPTSSAAALPGLASAPQKTPPPAVMHCSSTAFHTKHIFSHVSESCHANALPLLRVLSDCGRDDGPRRPPIQLPEPFVHGALPALLLHVRYVGP